MSMRSICEQSFSRIDREIQKSIITFAMRHLQIKSVTSPVSIESMVWTITLLDESLIKILVTDTDAYRWQWIQSTAYYNGNGFSHVFRQALDQKKITHVTI
jgi:hypothetical protein